jgi:hypothetical protein
MKYDSAIAFEYRIGLIKCLTDRAFKLCSDWFNFTRELDFLREMFSVNRFPQRVIETCFKDYLDAKFTCKCFATVPKNVMYFSIPYTNSTINNKIKQKLKAFIAAYYPQVEIRLIFRNYNTVGSMFRIKDRIPEFLRSNVVY